MANKVILAGNLGKDPEIRYTPGGAAVCSFSLATKEKFKDRDGNRQEETEWHNIVAWRQLAEICEKYLSKGSQIYVEGKIKTRKWEDRDGNTRYTTEIVIDNMEMLGGGRNNRNEDGGQPSRQSEQQQQPSSPQQQQEHTCEEPVFNPDDEIPFDVPPVQ